MHTFQIHLQIGSIQQIENAIWKEAVVKNCIRWNTFQKILRVVLNVLQTWALDICRKLNETVS